MANWRRRGDGIELRVYEGRDPLTSRDRYETKTIPLVGKREADRAWAAFATAVAGGEVASSGRRTFGELLERWFDKCYPDWSPGTMYQTRWIIDHRLAGLYGRALDAIDTAALDDFYTALRKRGGRGGRPLAVSSVVRVHGIVRLALDQAVRWKWLTENHAADANPGQPRSAGSSSRTRPTSAGCSPPRRNATRSCSATCSWTRRPAAVAGKSRCSG